MGVEVDDVGEDKVLKGLHKMRYVTYMPNECNNAASAVSRVDAMCNDANTLNSSCSHPGVA